jgi:hypothetical protein
MISIADGIGVFGGSYCPGTAVTALRLTTSGMHVVVTDVLALTRRALMAHLCRSARSGTIHQTSTARPEVVPPVRSYHFLPWLRGLRAAIEEDEHLLPQDREVRYQRKHGERIEPRSTRVFTRSAARDAAESPFIDKHSAPSDFRHFGLPPFLNCRVTLPIAVPESIFE